MSTLPRLIGVVHLAPLPGSPGAASLDPASALARAGLQAVEEARILEAAGFQGLILENFGDLPFYKDKVPPETIASLAVIAAAVREAVRIPIGINVLRNDASAALAIASVTGCDFIRVNVLTGVAATDQGLIEGQAAELLRERSRLGSEVAILADVHVKHAKPLSSDNLGHAIEDTLVRGLADGVIISGAGTGKVVEMSHLEEASRLARGRRTAFFVGSGATADLAPEFARLGAGVIVSSSLRRGGKAGQPLDSRRAREFAQAYLRKPKALPSRKTLKRGKKAAKKSKAR